MNEQRAGYRIVNQELSSELCLVRVIFPDGSAAAARVCNLNGQGIRAVFSSEDCAICPQRGDAVRIVFNYAGMDVAGRCVYAEQLDHGVTAMGASFTSALESAILSRYLLSAVRCREAV